MLTKMTNIAILVKQEMRIILRINGSIRYEQYK